jgi:hypothetical protein
LLWFRTYDFLGLLDTSLELRYLSCSIVVENVIDLMLAYYPQALFRVKFPPDMPTTAGRRHWVLLYLWWKPLSFRVIPVAGRKSESEERALKILKIQTAARYGPQTIRKM